MSQTSNPTFSQSGATGVDQRSTPPSQPQGSSDVIGRVEQTLTEIENACRSIDDERTVAFGLSVIIPVFNERQTLPKILDRIDEVMPEGTQTVVVDDASTDGTAQWLAALPPAIVKSPPTRTSPFG